MIQRLEELSLNSWPAMQQLLLDGWVVRFAGGYTRRSNSVSPLYDGRRPLAEKIATCEALYRAQGLPAIFKITEDPALAALDAQLAARGYTRQAVTSVQTAAIAALALPEPGAVRLWDGCAEEWLAASMAIGGHGSSTADRHREILRHIALPCCCAVALRAGQPAACGVAVQEGEYVGLYDIGTDPACRQQGHATRVVAALLGWAQARGAVHTYLQVMAENTPAQRLYAKLGYQHVYQYWYRVMPGHVTAH